MKNLIPMTTALMLAMSPLAAENHSDAEEGMDLVEEGAKLLLRGLLSEIEPTLRDFEGLAAEIGPAMKLLADEMGPAIAQIINQIDDIKNYQAPEILPNGDIIIRRRPEAPIYEEGTEIEL